ncbi:precorrin-6y C5,15-methyltransferase (decarboxylating) subunit CbiE, partial [Streptomyces sp. NPDC058953]
PPGAGPPPRGGPRRGGDGGTSNPAPPPQVLESLPEPDVVRIGGGGAETVAACADRRPERIVTHALTREAAEAVTEALSAGGYAVECVFAQSVAFDPKGWSERERAVVFLVSGRLPERAP